MIFGVVAFFIGYILTLFKNNFQATIITSVLILSVIFIIPIIFTLIKPNKIIYPYIILVISGVFIIFDIFALCSVFKIPAYLQIGHSAILSYVIQMLDIGQILNLIGKIILLVFSILHIKSIKLAKLE